MQVAATRNISNAEYQAAGSSDAARNIAARNIVRAAAGSSDAEYQRRGISRMRNIVRVARGGTVGQVAGQRAVGRAGKCSRVDRSLLLTLL